MNNVTLPAGTLVICTYRLPSVIQPWIAPITHGVIEEPGTNKLDWNGTNSERDYCEQTQKSRVRYDDGITPHVQHDSDDSLIVITAEQAALGPREKIGLFLGLVALAYYDLSSGVYSTLLAYQRGLLKARYGALLTKLMDEDPKLWPHRAGELAAAQLAYQAGKETIALEAEIRRGVSEDNPLAVLYDWLVDHDNIKRELIDLSGTRTLLSDMEALREQDEKDQWIRLYQKRGYITISPIERDLHTAQDWKEMYEALVEEQDATEEAELAVTEGRREDS